MSAHTPSEARKSLDSSMPSTMSESALGQTIEKLDPSVVDWTENDPENPLNWPKSQRLGHVVLISAITLLANLSATLFAPAASLLLSEFHITSSILGTLSVSLFLLGFALGPLLISSLSELYGRLPVYHATNIIFLAFTIACGFATNMESFLVFRFIAGCAGSAPLTIGGGTVADVVPKEERGKAMGLFATGPLLGPVIGPIIGGFIAQAGSWRWAFWGLAIASGVITIVSFLFMRETYAPILLSRRCAALRKSTGNLDLVSKGASTLPQSQMVLRALVKPTKLLILSPIVVSLSLFCAFVFGLVFLLFTTFPMVFGTQYRFSKGASGLSYLGIGLGMVTGLVVFGRLSDPISKKLAGKNGKGKPEDRLPLMVLFTPLIPLGFFMYGWSADKQTHWIVPIIGTALVGMGSLFVIMPTQLYLVDVFGAEGAASALAANTVLRSLGGAFLPMAGPKLYEALGLGWGNSTLGFVALGFAIVPLGFWRWGEKVRERWGSAHV